MTLDELITALEAADPTLVVEHGFNNPHSYRGDYLDLAFEPTTNITVGAMLADARAALGATYQGYKGGEFTMTADTWCWLSAYGDASCETLSPLALQAMLADPAAPTAPADADLRTLIRGVIRDCPALYPDDIADRVWAALPAPADRAAVALAEVRRLCEMTIEGSVRVDAIHQARDTLAVIDRRMADEAQAPACDHDSQVIEHEGSYYWACLKCGKNHGRVADEATDRVLDERVAAAKEQQAGEGR